MTEENAEEYINLLIDYTFYGSCKPQFEAFKRGFYRTLEEATIKSFFKPEELEQLVCGSQLLDFETLREKAKYRNGYTKDHEIIQWLFEIIINDLTEEQQRKFLSFSTGSDRSPVGGLGRLPFYIERHGDDTE